MAAELEERLLGAVGRGGETVGAEAHPGKEGDQGKAVVDARVEEVLGTADEHPAQSVEHAWGI